ncbi:ankyrin repeat domain-containing protein [Aquimarina sp. MMG016]|uniref:ankyrin repeat domain-containing protein n=1 Tax=Aquimarina sp. MMG016 TaxID=2822690 RepID=UPI001B3A7075|nr:ankyrin repeat domain-containing protein [Aquimarina sp. MMG016]MBQ4822276.1 ankyrin repeat domain-containing protein [Aquimarina sp. MMG016]
MRKLTVLVLCMTIGLVLANDPVKDLRPYAVKKTEITNVSPFCISVAKGDYEMVKKMIELGTEVNSFSGGMTPLMYAARYNRVEIIKLLVANGAKISRKDAKGNTAARYAERSGANDAINMLKELKQK